MKDIVIGVIILVCVFLVVDFIYTEKNVCTISTDNQEYKCGILKTQLDTELYLFDRYW